MSIETDFKQRFHQQDDFNNVLSRFDDYFIVQVLCKECQKIIKISSFENIFMHHYQCCQEGKRAVEFNIIQEEKELDLKIQEIDQKDNLIKTDLTQQSQIILQKEVNQILSKGKIKTTSQKKYQKSLEKFYCWLYSSTGRKDPTAKDLELYLQQNDLTLYTLNALNRLKLIKRIPLNTQQKQLFKLQRITAQEKVQPKPHQSWSIDTIQEFINELFSNNFIIMAYRIYILFELASRMGELKQITFGMIISGQISYIPEKQSSRKELARRKLIIRDDIIATTKRFIDEIGIIESSTLNIGYQKDHVKERAMHHQLSTAISFLSERKIARSQQLNELFKGFSYHDLRHSKLTYLKDIGVCKYQISEFVGHSDWRVTQKYLKKASGQKMNLEAQIEQNKEVQRSLKLYIGQ